MNFYAAPRTGKFQKNSLKLLLGGGVIDIRTFERRRIMEELDAAESGGGGGLKKPPKNFTESQKTKISKFPIAEKFSHQNAVRENGHFGADFVRLREVDVGERERLGVGRALGDNFAPRVEHGGKAAVLRGSA